MVWFRPALMNIGVCMERWSGIYSRFNDISYFEKSETQLEISAIPE